MKELYFIYKGVDMFKEETVILIENNIIIYKQGEKADGLFNKFLYT